MPTSAREGYGADQLVQIRMEARRRKWLILSLLFARRPFLGTPREFNFTKSRDPPFRPFPAAVA